MGAETAATAAGAAGATTAAEIASAVEGANLLANTAGAVNLADIANTAGGWVTPVGSFGTTIPNPDLSAVNALQDYYSGLGTTDVYSPFHNPLTGKLEAPETLTQGKGFAGGVGFKMPKSEKKGQSAPFVLNSPPPADIFLPEVAKLRALVRGGFNKAR